MIEQYARIYVLYRSALIRTVRLLVLFFVLVLLYSDVVLKVSSLPVATGVLKSDRAVKSSVYFSVSGVHPVVNASPNPPPKTRTCGVSSHSSA